MVSVPGLVEEVKRCLRETTKHLLELPSQPSEPPHLYIQQLCQKFRDALTESLKGENDNKDLLLLISKADETFLEKVQSSICQFGLADYDELREGKLERMANEFLDENRN
jgi:hypothetical protein